MSTTLTVRTPLPSSNLHDRCQSVPKTWHKIWKHAKCDGDAVPGGKRHVLVAFDRLRTKWLQGSFERLSKLGQGGHKNKGSLFFASRWWEERFRTAISSTCWTISQYSRKRALLGSHSSVVRTRTDHLSPSGPRSACRCFCRWQTERK